MEFSHIRDPITGKEESDIELIKFMKEKGYKVRATVLNSSKLAWDIIFVKEGFHEDVTLEDVKSHG